MYAGHDVMLAVRLNCRKECQGRNGRREMEQVRLARGDASLFEGIDPAQGTCPVPAMVGVPIVVRRLAAPASCQSKADFDNITATQLHIKPTHGYAPVAWALYLGPCIVYRADGRDLTVDDLDSLDSFMKTLLDKYSDRCVAPERDLTPAALDMSVTNDMNARRCFARANNRTHRRLQLTLRKPMGS